MRIAVLPVLFAASLLMGAGPAPKPDEPVDPHLLVIDAGRLGVMMDQSADALNAVAPFEPPGAMDSPSARHAYVLRILIGAVLRYNFVSHEACRRHAVNAKLCAGPYLPPWLGEAPETDHDDAALRAMLDEASGRLIPFWEELCAKAKTAATDQNFCAIE